MIEKHMQDAIIAQFKEWKRLTDEARPIHQQKIKASQELYMKNLKSYIRKFITKWRDIALGPHSRKTVKKNGQQRYLDARKRLWDRGISGRITAEMIKKEMAADASMIIEKRWDRYVLNKYNKV